MKHLKTKLMASVAMLMVATVMISSASFAWFTLSTQPEVSGVQTGLATSQSLEIALVGTNGFGTAPTSSNNDTGKNTTWGNLVDVSTFFGDDHEKTLKPVAVSGEETTTLTLTAPTFGEDGRTSGTQELETEYQEVDSDDSSTAYHDGAVKVWKKSADNGGAVYAYQIDYFMRTNTADLDIKLLSPDSSNLDRGSNGSDGNAINGAGTYIDDGDDDATTYSKCKVAFRVSDGTTAGNWKVFYDGGDDHEWDYDTALITDAVPDQIYQVSMLVYWDGDDATAADLAKEEMECNVNAQFTTYETGTTTAKTLAGIE